MRKLIALFIALLAGPALAVSTSHWTQTSQADFKAGTLHNVVATNLNDIKLSRQIDKLLEQDPDVSMVTSLAQAKDGAVYAGTAPQAKLLRISEGKVSTVLKVDEAVSITSLLAEPDGGLLLGVSGAKGKVLKIDKPGAKPHELFSAKDEQYIWALSESSDGTIYAASGPNGELFAIHPSGAAEVLYKSDENNLTCMASDGKDNLYVGTDPDGLVVRINRQTKEAFVLYNADEAEITALAMDSDGVLYAATGQISPPQPAPAGDGQPKEQSGRPESGTTVPLPSKQPNPPAPPPPAKPPAGQPPPIPQQPRTSANFRTGQPVMLMDDPGSGPGDQPPDQPAPGIPGTPGSEPAGAADQAKDEDKSAKAPGQAEADQNKPQGNAIYKIDQDGFVTEIFREQVVIYSMICSNGVLLVGTGDDGEIYQVDPAAEETEVVAKTDAKEVSSLLSASDGRIYLGLSNTGSLASMTNGYAPSGTFTSPVLDASQVSRFGVIQLHGSLPAGTALTVSTRSGNIKDATSPGWSPWSAPAKAQEFMHIDSPSARFLQYRINFTTTDSSQTPVISDVDVAYQLPHLAPMIKSIKLSDTPPAVNPSAVPQAGADKPAKPVGGSGVQTITWDSFDLDGDPLVYSLYFRTSPGEPWILLKDKLADLTYAWDTKTVADGRYQVKVVASDALANPPGEGKTASRISDTVIVDNTPPAIGDIKTVINGQSVQISLRVTDQTSTVASMEFNIDSNENWQTVLPTDKIFDEPEERVQIELDAMAAGEHQITLRATDSRGNVAFQTVEVTVANK